MMKLKVVPSLIFVLYSINFCERANSEEKKSGSSLKPPNFLIPKRFWSVKHQADEAERLVKKQKFGDALTFYTRIIEKEYFSEQYLYYVRRGKCHMEINDCENLLSAAADFKIGLLCKEPNRSAEGILEGEVLVTLAEKILKQCYPPHDQRVQSKIEWCYKEAITRESSKELYRYYVLRGKYHTEINSCSSLLMAVEDFQSAFEKAPKYSDGGTSIVEESALVTLADKISNYCDHTVYIIALKIKWCYDQAIKINPFSAKYFRKRGLCYFQGFEDTENAISDLRQAIQLDSEDEENYMSLKDIILQSKKFDDNVKESMTLLKDDPLSSLCIGLKIGRKFKAALYCFTEAMERNPGNEELNKIYLERASCYREMNQLEMAIREHRNRIQLNLHDMEKYWYPFVEFLFDNGRFKELEEDINILNNDELEELASIFMSKKKFKYALCIYEETIKRNSSKTLYYRLRADCYLKMGKKDEAIADLKIWVEKHPENVDDRMEYKMLLISGSHIKELVDLGLQYFRGNKFRAAIETFDGTLLKDAKCEICYEKRALCHWKLKNYEEAISDLEEVIKLADWDLIPKIELCEVLVDAKVYDRAKTHQIQQTCGCSEAWSDVMESIKAHLDRNKKRKKAFEHFRHRIDIY